MMKLIKISEWIDKTFSEDSAPNPSTVRRWIERGYVQGKQIGNLWFIIEVDNKKSLIDKVLHDATG